MPIEDIFSISGRGTVVTGRVERGKGKGGEEIEIVGIRPTGKRVVKGGEMFKKLLEEGGGGEKVGLMLGGAERGDGEGRGVVAKGGRRRCEGGEVCVEEGGGGGAPAVFQRVPAAVLLADEGCEGGGEAGGGDRDGDAGGQCSLGDRADHADSDGEGVTV